MIGYLFTYETLRDRALDEKVLGHFVPPAIPSILYDWKKIHVDKDYYTLDPAPGELTLGMVYPIDMERDLEILDNWEDLYERIEVELLQVLGPVQGPVWTYVLK
jgi:hypothetical protein